MAKPVLGAQLYTVRQHTQNLADLTESLKKVAGIGYRAVQTSGFGAIDSKDVAALLEDNQLICAATHGNWDQFVNNLDSVIDEHKMWHCTHTAIGSLPDSYRSEQGLDRFLKELRPVAETLVQEGMDFSYHNHSHELARLVDSGKTWLQVLYERADPAHLKAEIDTYWIQHGGGDPAYWVKKMAGREPLLHLKDMIVTATREQRFAEIGQGNLNWEAILAEAASAGVEWYLVEQDNCFDRDPFESLAISYRFLADQGLS